MARAYEVIVYDGPLPPLGVMLGQSPAEAAFLDLQTRPGQFSAWAAEARAAWHKRAGVEPRKVERS